MTCDSEESMFFLHIPAVRTSLSLEHGSSIGYAFQDSKV